MKKLIVNADDFGRSAGVNRGILDTHQRGIVTSTTVMINYPDAAPGLEQALAEAPKLGIGLHLNLTSGQPVSAPEHVASLVGDDGRFYHISAWAQHYDRFDPDHLQREIAAQVARFIAIAGRPPDHLDAHHHATYLHPTTLQAMFDIARGYAIPMREGIIDQSPDVIAQFVTGLLPDVDADQMLRIVEAAKAVLDDQPDPPFWPAALNRSFFDRTVTLGDLLVILTTLPDDGITELMCHPGYVDEGFTSSYAHQRETEIAHLTHPATRECVQYEFIDLITFGDVPRP